MVNTIKVEGLSDDEVIDNKEVILAEELSKHCSEAAIAYIAVGYFFISGLGPIINDLKKVGKIYLLISNETDKVTAETLIEGYQRITEANKKIKEITDDTDDKKEHIKYNTKQNVKNSLECMVQTPEENKLVNELLNMMENGKIEIRVYPKEKLHAKAYMLSIDGPNPYGVGIVGSSNLSLAGISQNTELNLKTRSTGAYEKLVKWFDGLWEIGIDSTDDFKILFKRSWAAKPYSEQDLYHKALDTEYSSGTDMQNIIDPVWAQSLPELFSFQTNAVKKGADMLNEYNGVMISDVVGLGKTFVGITLLKYLNIQDYNPLIICPPALEEMWSRFKAVFEVKAEIISRGKLSKSDYELEDDYNFDNIDVVLIDESHHFRNKGTRQYENLKNFMDKREAKAILLTATPFSNDVSDIQNQIELFHPDNRTNIPAATGMDLDKFFKHAVGNRDKFIEFLKEIMIRRMRKDVVEESGGTDDDGRSFILLGDEKKYFPKRELITLRYDVNQTYDQKYNSIVQLLKRKTDDNPNGLTMARYSLGSYLHDEYKGIKAYDDLFKSGPSLVGLIRNSLLKRMESSTEAFKVSINHYIDTHNIFVDLLDKGIVPVGKNYNDLFANAEDNSDFIEDSEALKKFQNRVESKGSQVYEINAFKVDELKSDIQKDIKVFEEIKKLLESVNVQNDKKLLRLQALLDDDYKGKKILVFSEFSTTVKYLHDNIIWDGNKDYTNSDKGDSIECARRFDPDNNPGKAVPEDKQLTLLFTTDVLSEGVNLQAGDVMINYDFHWNPTRLFQRAGRTDRIGSENEKVTIHNFLFDSEMNKDLGSEKAVKNKLDNIFKFIGTEDKIFDIDDQISKENYYKIYNDDLSILDKKEYNILEASEYEKDFQNIKNNNPNVWEAIKNIPAGIRSSDGTKEKGNLLLMCKRGKFSKRYVIKQNRDVIPKNIDDFLGLLKSNKTVPVKELPDDYDSLLKTGWKRFIQDSDQARAEAKEKIPKVQEKVLGVINQSIIEADQNDDEAMNRLDILLKAFQIPIKKSPILRKLKKKIKEEVSNEELIEYLGKIYRHYKLEIEPKVEKDEKPVISKIIYSKYVGGNIE